MGSHYLITVDRLTNWPRIEQGLVDSLRFMNFGIAEKISSVGGPEFVALKTEKIGESITGYHQLAYIIPTAGLKLV